MQKTILPYMHTHAYTGTYFQDPICRKYSSLLISSLLISSHPILSQKNKAKPKRKQKLQNMLRQHKRTILKPAFTPLSLTVCLTLALTLALTTVTTILQALHKNIPIGPGQQGPQKARLAVRDVDPFGAGSEHAGNVGCVLAHGFADAGWRVPE
jgi:hypothetical protein